MTVSQLQPIDRFHHELKSLAATGIPVELGTDGDERQLISALDEIHASLRVRVSLGQSLEEAIRQDERLPERYRAAAQAWLSIDSPTAVLDSVTDSEVVDQGWNRSIALSLLQTLVTWVLITLGLVLASLWLSPKVDAIYAQLHQTPPTAARFLSAVRDWLPIWATAATLVFLVAVWLWYRSGRGKATRWATYLPMVRRRQLMVRNARFADYLASWLQHDLPLHDGIRFAAALSRGSRAPQTASAVDQSQRETDKVRSQDDQPSLALPPLIGWAVQGEPADEPIAQRLRAVAEVYRGIADRQLTLWTHLIPMIAAACLCGLAVLLYGLGVFLPVIGLLEDVSVPGAY